MQMEEKKGTAFFFRKKMRDGRGVLDIAHKQTTSERAREEKLSRRALLGAAAFAAAAAAAAAVLLGSRSATAPETHVAEPVKAEQNTGAASDPPETLHDVDAAVDKRRAALCGLSNTTFPTRALEKLADFPAFVTLLCDENSRNILLDAVIQIEETADHLDEQQTKWLLGELLGKILSGSENSGAAYARVVARQRRLRSKADLVVVGRLGSMAAVREYIAAISADPADPISYEEFRSIVAEFFRVVQSDDFLYTYPILEIDRSLAAIARRVVVPKFGATGSIVRIGCKELPETMGALAVAFKIGGILKGHTEIPRPLTLTAARFLVAVNPKHPFSEEEAGGLRDESLKGENLGAIIPESIATFASAFSVDEIEEKMRIALQELDRKEWLPLWQRHQLVRKVVSSDSERLQLFLVAHTGDMDKVILALRATDKTAIAGVQKVLRERALGDISIAIERAGVRALLEPFLDTIEAVVGSNGACAHMVRYAAALGRSGRRAESGNNLDMDALRRAWERAPASVLDAAKYWNVGGNELFGLLVAGAKWGRYEQISKMTNLFGDWTPNAISFADIHSRMVGAFFGLCDKDEARDSDSMARRWFCSESGSHDDAMVALVFRRKATGDAIALTQEGSKSRGLSGIHGFLLVPGNGPSETSGPSETRPKGWANSPTALHAEKVKLVRAASDPCDVVRAVRMTPWLVTFVDPSEAPMLMALITLVRECAAFLDKAQLDALGARGDQLRFDVAASCPIVHSVQAGSAELISSHVYAALSGLRDIIASKQEPKSAMPEEEAQEGKEVGEADIRRMLSAAYTDEIRGVRGVETYISTRVIDPLPSDSRRFDVARNLITEYSSLLESRKIHGWGLLVRLSDTPRSVEPLFGRKRQFV